MFRGEDSTAKTPPEIDFPSQIETMTPLVIEIVLTAEIYGKRRAVCLDFDRRYRPRRSSPALIVARPILRLGKDIAARDPQLCSCLEHAETGFAK